MRRALVLALVAAGLLSTAPSASAVTFSDVVLPGASGVGDVVAGRDGNLWVSEEASNRVEKVVPGTGAVAGTFPMLTAGATPTSIVSAGGFLWATEFNANKIARITTAGTVTEIAVPTAGAKPLRSVTGPDGNVWFTEFGAAKVGRLRVSDNNVTEFALPFPASGIAVADGAIWVTQPAAKAIRRVDVNGTVGPALGAGQITLAPFEIVGGPDGNLWFVESNATTSIVARMTPAGAVTEFPLDPNGDPSMAIGTDANLWFTQFNRNRVGRVTPAGAFTFYPAAGAPAGIAAGPDGRLYFAQFGGGRLGRITLDPPTVVTGAAAGITATTAALIATVNPQDYPASVVFEFGPTEAYGSTAASQTVPTATAPVNVTADLSGLSPSTTYHFRVKATTAAGQGTGADATFTTAAAPVSADADGDGFPKGVDCNDAGPAIHPGAADVPGNGVDEDCSGADARLARVSTPVQYLFRAGRRTAVLRLRVRQVPAGATVELRCAGGGCFKGVKRVRVAKAGTVDLRRRFLRRTRLRPGARLEVRVIVPYRIGKVNRYKVRRNKLPVSRTLCLPPRAAKPVACS